MVTNRHLLIWTRSKKLQINDIFKLFSIIGRNFDGQKMQEIGHARKKLFPNYFEITIDIEFSISNTILIRILQ